MRIQFTDLVCGVFRIVISIVNLSKIRCISKHVSFMSEEFKVDLYTEHNHFNIHKLLKIFINIFFVFHALSKGSNDYPCSG